MPYTSCTVDRKYILSTQLMILYCFFLSAPAPHLSYRPAPPSPLVDPSEQTVNEGDPVQFRCWVPGNPGARLRWTKAGGVAIPIGATDDGKGMLYIPRAETADQGQYVCSMIDPSGGPPVQSKPAKLLVEPVERCNLYAACFSPQNSVL